VKCGYPPRTLVLISELPVSSLGIERGDQLMVSELKEPAAPVVRASEPPLQPESIPGGFTEIQGPSSPDSVSVSGGSLVHRVNIYAVYAPKVLKTQTGCPR
jgi:ubiquitin thioesterase OTU1